MSDTDTPEVVDLDQPDTPTDNVTVTESDPAPEVDPEVDAEDQDDADAGSSREAKKYRLKLRAAEAERDALAAKVEALQRQAVDRLADAEGIKPAAVWAAGAQLSDLLGDDGTVDTDRVAAAIEAARETLGVPVKRGNVVPREGRNPAPPRPSGIDGMTAAVMGRRQ